MREEEEEPELELELERLELELEQVRWVWWSRTERRRWEFVRLRWELLDQRVLKSTWPLERGRKAGRERREGRWGSFLRYVIYAAFSSSTYILCRFNDGVVWERWVCRCEPREKMKRKASEAAVRVLFELTSTLLLPTKPRASPFPPSSPFFTFLLDMNPSTTLATSVSVDLTLWKIGGRWMRVKRDL